MISALLTAVDHKMIDPKRRRLISRVIARAEARGQSINGLWETYPSDAPILAYLDPPEKMRADVACHTHGLEAKNYLASAKYWGACDSILLACEFAANVHAEVLAVEQYAQAGVSDYTKLCERRVAARQREIKQQVADALEIIRS